MVEKKIEKEKVCSSIVLLVKKYMRNLRIVSLLVGASEAYVMVLLGTINVYKGMYV